MCGTDHMEHWIEITYVHVSSFPVGHNLIVDRGDPSYLWV